MTTREEMLATIRDAAARIAEGIEELNPTAAKLLEGLRLLRAEIGTGGDFRFWSTIHTGGDVVIETTCPTGVPGKNVRVEVKADGSYICVDRGSAKTHLNNRDSKDIVRDALNYVAAEAAWCGQLAQPAPAAEEPGLGQAFGAAATQKNQTQLLIEQLFMGLDVVASITGAVFETPHMKASASGNVELSTTVRTDTSSQPLTIRVDEQGVVRLRIGAQDEVFNTQSPVDNIAAAVGFIASRVPSPRAPQQPRTKGPGTI